ncbi:SNase-domain-containing protein [Xylona heveae TC161]|uniref:Probable endonuclease LCL3 n=1 Tax=Xylona heveae (strain CBS 132557 / TC161) TaxID=1328760 RepID=A0A165J8I2_XYLHT|nr:SNase-domain-containing protein [Xylona heveae TC161]KZF25893.1 SNase-domain-containing protein [Xylona heveae TC161]
MKWPPWSSKSQDDRDDSERSVSWTNSLNVTDWSHYTDPRTIVPTILLTGTTLFFVRIYRSYLRRIPAASSIHPDFFRRRSLFGQVTSVGDGDNFRLFHTPGGRLAGWGWMPGRRVPVKKEELKGKTIHIRLAGVDAPELSHFGKPAQPFSKQALDWLTSYISNRRVRAYIYKRDQYDRVVSTVYVRRWLLRRDVGLEMLKRGLATVYEAKSGAEFGKLEAKYRNAEWWAKKRRKGMWSAKKADFESPREFKTRMSMLEDVKDPKS